MMNFLKMLGVCAAVLAMVPGSSAAAPTEDPPYAPIEKADFFRPGFAPVRANGPYDITVVYFFDYQCPVCRQYHGDVSRALAEDKRVRVIYRDTPMLGPNSDAAANAAIASQLQGRHEALHNALMSTKGPIDATALRAAARKAGVDWDRLQRDLKTHESKIELLVARNFELAVDTGIHGTPAFIVGDALANGALDYAGLKGEIADARKARQLSTAASSAPPADGVETAEASQADTETDPNAKLPSSSDPPPTASPIFRESRTTVTGTAVKASPFAHGKVLNGFWLAGAGALILAAATVVWWRGRRLRH